VTPYVAAWARAFLFTVMAELVVVTPLLAPSGDSIRRRALGVLLANLASHPAVWFVGPELSFAPPTRLALSEAWAVGVELAVYLLLWPRLGRTRAFAASALGNGVSLGLGLALRALGAPV
jgi:hypothetical protein